MADIAANNPFVVSWDFWKDQILGKDTGTSNAERIAQDAYENDKKAGASEAHAQQTYNQVKQTAQSTLYTPDNPWDKFFHALPLIVTVIGIIAAIHIVGKSAGSVSGLVRETSKGLKDVIKEVKK